MEDCEGRAPPTPQGMMPQGPGAWSELSWSLLDGCTASVLDMTCHVPMKCHDKWLENGENGKLYAIYIFYYNENYVHVCVCSFLAVAIAAPGS